MAKRPARHVVPTFNSEAEERAFWETHDASPFVDWNTARVAIFPNLKPSTETISLCFSSIQRAPIRPRSIRFSVLLRSFLRLFQAARFHHGDHVIGGHRQCGNHARAILLE